jgi:WD40 repeat protein
MLILRTPGGPASHLEFTPDGRRLFAQLGPTLAGWGLPGGEGWETPGAAAWLGRLCGPQRVVALTRAGLCVLDLMTGEVQGLVSAGSNLGVLAFSAAAGLVAGVDTTERDLYLWGWPGLKPLPVWAEGTSYAPSDAIGLSFSPDGRRLALIDRAPNVAVLDPATGEQRWSQRVFGMSPYGRLCWSPDGRWLAAASGASLTILSAERGEILAYTRLASKYYQDIAVTPCGRFLAGVSNEKTVKVYETATWSLRHELGWSIGPLKTLAFSSDGMLGAAGGAKKVVVWDVDW